MQLNKDEVMILSKGERKEAKITHGISELKCVEYYSHLYTIFTKDGMWEKNPENRLEIFVVLCIMLICLK